jgi:hypothetical protein
LGEEGQVGVCPATHEGEASHQKGLAGRCSDWQYRKWVRAAKEVGIGKGEKAGLLIEGSPCPGWHREHLERVKMNEKAGLLIED